MNDKQTAQTTIPIFFTADDGYAPYLGVALNSIIANADPKRHYTIVVLEENVSEEHIAKLRALVEGHDSFEIRIIPMAGKIQGIHDRVGNRLRTDYFTMTIFFRIFIPEMFPEWDKGIYIDSDIVVPGDISEMYDTELGDNYLGVCRDLSIMGVPELVDYLNYGAGVGAENYFNSGVLVMNMKALRERKLAERFLELFNTYNFESVAPDQDYLNVLCYGKVVYMSNEWDAMPVDGEPEIENPKLIHYNLFEKPWLYDDIPYESYFWQYAEGTGFEAEARAAKAAYTDEQKQKDAESLARIAANGEALAHDPEHNFASVFNTGKEPRL